MLSFGMLLTHIIVYGNSNGSSNETEILPFHDCYDDHLSRRISPQMTAANISESLALIRNLVDIESGPHPFSPQNDLQKEVDHHVVFQQVPEQFDDKANMITNQKSKYLANSPHAFGVYVVHGSACFVVVVLFALALYSIFKYVE